jgi:4-amino-4-deoxy-L-arabinose transferase-like glycosyltransferase
MSSPTIRHGFLNWLSTPMGVAVFWLGFGLAFILLQQHFSPGLQPDDAEVAEVLQRRLSLAYEVRNAPLYDWLLWGVQRLLGEGTLSHRALRYGLMGAFGLLTYAAMREAKADQKLAAAASLSLLLFSWFGWDFHYRVTHTLPMLAAGMLSWMLALRLRERPGALYALGLGLAFGLGEISKWSFGIFAFGLIGALLCDERGRRALMHPRALLIVLGAMVPIIPVVLGIAALNGDLAAMTEHNLIAEGSAHALRAVQGLGLLLIHSLLFQLPWLVFVAAATGRTRKAGAAHGDAALMRLAFLTTGIAAGLAALGVVAFGVTHINARYLFPVFMVLPLGVFLWTARRVDVERFSRLLMITSLAAALTVFAVRTASYVLPIDKTGPEYSALIPYDGLAEQLAAKGLGKARFVSNSFRDAANLLAFLPDAEAASVNTQRLVPAFGDASLRDCVVIWRAGRLTGDVSAINKTVPADLTRIAGFKPDDIEPLIIPWPRRFFIDSPAAVWLIGRGENAKPACAEVFKL